jgi:hypothetical protein
LPAKPPGFPPPQAATARAQAAPRTQPAPASETHSAGQPVGQEQPTILPDEMRPWVRPEQFLPFFQLPGSNGPGAPAPEKIPTLPPSTAIYKEQ